LRDRAPRVCPGPSARGRPRPDPRGRAPGGGRGGGRLLRPGAPVTALPAVHRNDARSVRVCRVGPAVFQAVAVSTLTGRGVEPTLGFEPRTCCLRNSCSTAELCRPEREYRRCSQKSNSSPHGGTPTVRLPMRHVTPEWDPGLSCPLAVSVDEDLARRINGQRQTDQRSNLIDLTTLR